MGVEVKDLGTKYNTLKSFNSVLGVSVNVKHYGATGDGVTDDRASILSALSFLSTNGGTLFFPSGVYIISDTIEITSNITVVGDGIDSTVIKPNVDDAEFALNEGFLYTDSDYVKISNITIDGRYLGVKEDDEMPNRTSGIVLLNNSTNCIIEDVSIKNTTRHGVMVMGENHIIENVKVENTASYNISFGNGDLIANATKNCILNNFIGYGSLSKMNLEINDGVSKIVISNFILKGGEGDFQCAAIRIGDHDRPNESNSDIVINCGIIDNNRAAAAINIGCSGESYANTHENIVLSNIKILSRHYAFWIRDNVHNLIINNVDIVAKRGITIFKSFSTTDGSNMVSISNSTITIEDGDSGKSAFNIEDAQNINISNVMVKGGTANGIDIINSNDVSINACKIFDNAGNGISLSGAGSKLMINSSFVGNIDTTNQLFGINNASGFSDLMIVGNHFSNATGENTGDAFGVDVLSRSNKGIADTV